MRVYLAILAKGERPVPDLDRIHHEAARSLPFQTAGASGAPDASWRADSRRVLIAAWTNEPAQPDRPLLSAPTTPGATGFSGYLHDPAPDAVDLVEEQPELDLGGVWSLFAATDHGIAAATCASGAEMVFRAETPDLVVLGNRALLVHLVADPTGPHPDLLGLASVLNSGYAVTDRTGLRGVEAIAPGRHVTAGLSGTVATRDFTDVGTAGPATAADVAAALVASVRPLRDSPQPVRLGLTGGRDSRLLVALLTHAGVPVNTHTSGRDDDPDVVVAREVAERLGVPHKVGAPMGAAVKEDGVTFDVASRVREAVVLGEGMLSAYDRVGRIDDHYNATTVPFAGSGGEILRAYYAGSLEDPSDTEAVVKYMRGRLRQSTKRMAKDSRAAYEADTQPWMDAASATGAASLEDFYVRQRTGRWTGAARGSASIGSLARRPYLDHRVVTLVRRVPLQDRMDERLIADVLDVLAPELASVRFAGRRWKFDEVAPTDPAARAEWEARAPVTGAHGDQASLNWRTDLPEVRTELAQIVRGAPAAFWELADRRRVEEFLAQPDGRTRADTMKMWHLATVADALTHDFHVGPAKFTAEAHETVAALPTAAPTPDQPSRLERGARRIARTVRDRVRR